MVKKNVVIPAGMMSIELNRSLRQSDAALPIAGERNHDGQESTGGAVPRVERNGPLCILAERGEIASKEVHRREFFPTHLAGRINLDGSPGGLARALQRFLPRIEPIEILKQVYIGKTGPGGGVVGLAFQRPFQTCAEQGMLSGIELLKVSVVTQDKFGRAEFLHLTISSG